MYGTLEEIRQIDGMNIEVGKEEWKCCIISFINFNFVRRSANPRPPAPVLLSLFAFIWDFELIKAHLITSVPITY